jgi:hypothetical protein
MLEKTCSPVILIILHLSYGSTGLLDRALVSDRSSGPASFRDESRAKKKPVRKRAKGRIRFGLSLDEKRPRYREVVKFF